MRVCARMPCGLKSEKGGELLTDSAIHMYNRRDDFAPIMSGVPIFKKNLLTYEQVRETS